jgi:hypothetical protein
MSLDVYVGSLTRYYTEGPIAVVERLARQQRIPYAIIHGNGVDQCPGLDQVVRRAVLAWRDHLALGLGDRLATRLDWDESLDSPCFSEKPGWDSYGATLLLAAHEQHPELPLPAAVTPDWPDNPAYLAATAEGSGGRYDQLLIPELWLPHPLGFTFRSQDVTGQDVEIGSSVDLLAQLHTLGEAHPPNGDRPIAVAAHEGLRVLIQMTEHSVRHRLPMKLDF